MVQSFGASETVLSYPFRFSGRGTVATTSDYATIWDQRVRMALLTRRGERFGRLAYGTNLADVAMTGSSTVVNTVEDEIRQAFPGLLPELTLDDVTVVYDELTNELTVDVLYTLPNQQQNQTAVGFITVDGTLAPSEEAL